MSTPEELLTAFPRGGRLFVLPQWKLAYVSIKKNACTSLKWLMAELGGEDLDALRRGGFNYTPGLDGHIHRRDRWQVVPPIAAIDRDLWEQVVHDDGWMVFGVLRDPRLRHFSAWQDKYLLRNPGYWQTWENSGPLPTSAEQVISEFADFCRSLVTDPEHPAHEDGHFRSQTRALKLGLVPYRRLYDLSELDLLMTDLNRHVAALGHPGGLVLARSNSSPFKPCGALFENGVREDIEKLFAEDFANFGDRWDFGAVEATPVPWTAESFSHANSLIEVHERLAEVVRLGRATQRREKSLRRRVTGLNQRLEVIRRRNQDLRRRVLELESRPSGPRRLASVFTRRVRIRLPRLSDRG